MDTQLSNKKIVCKEFIQALHSCHAGGWARFTGECNEARSELNRCLQSDHLSQSTNNKLQYHKMTSENPQKAEQIW